MQRLMQILAESDFPTEAIAFVIGLIIWGIGALAKQVKQGSERQKERLRQMRESIEHARRESGQPKRQPARQPPPAAAQAPRRSPPQIPQKKRSTARQKQKQATDYNAMATSQRRLAAPPPLPIDSEEPTRTRLAEETERVIAAPASVVRKPATVTAPAIRRWLTPATLRQQFILTELFQPPLALRNEER